MNISSYHLENPQPSASYCRGNPQAPPPPHEGPSTFVEPKPKSEVQPSPEEPCPVCGDRVSGYHYGLLTCESCKGFFKRSVQNNKHYTCPERQSCPMDLAQRKRCPYCRFQKCLAVGMRREAVRADRMRGGRNKFGPLYRRDRQLKQQRGFHQPNSGAFKIKLETSRPTLSSLPHDFPHHLAGPFPAPLDHSQPLPNTQPELLPMMLDCSLNRDRALTTPPLTYTGLYHPAFYGYPPDPRDTPLAYGQATAAPSAIFTSLHMDNSGSEQSEAPTHTSDPLWSSTSFLSELLRGELDESQVCSRVVATLRREQASRGKHDCLNTFSIMCKMADQTLFGLVEWARNCALFKELKVEDQMVLLQSCWSELLVLDHLVRQVHYGREGGIYLVTGQQIEVMTVLSQAGAKLSSLVSRSQDLVSKLKNLQLDKKEFVCLKYLVLFNPDVKSVQDRRRVEVIQERVNRALMEHTVQAHPGQSDKFGQLLLRLPEVRSISLQAEEYLYQRHLLGDLPCNSLLTEMLHAKHT